MVSAPLARACVEGQEPSSTIPRARGDNVSNKCRMDGHSRRKTKAWKDNQKEGREEKYDR